MEYIIGKFYPFFWRKFKFPVVDYLGTECDAVAKVYCEAIWVHKIVSFYHWRPLLEVNLNAMVSSVDSYVSYMFFMLSSAIQDLPDIFESFLTACSLSTAVAAFAYDRGHHEFLKYSPDILTVFLEENYSNKVEMGFLWAHLRYYLIECNYSEAYAIVEEKTEGNPFASLVNELDFVTEIKEKIKSKISVPEHVAVYRHTKKVISRFQSRTSRNPSFSRNLTIISRQDASSQVEESIKNIGEKRISAMHMELIDLRLTKSLKGIKKQLLENVKSVISMNDMEVVSANLDEARLFRSLDDLTKMILDDIKSVCSDNREIISLTRDAMSQTRKVEWPEVEGALGPDILIAAGLEIQESEGHETGGAEEREIVTAEGLGTARAEGPETRVTETPDTDDAETSETGDAEMPETEYDADLNWITDLQSGDSFQPFRTPRKFSETRDTEIPETRDEEILETRDAETPDTDDAETVEIGDAEILETEYDAYLNWISAFQSEDSCQHLRTPKKLDSEQNSALNGETINLLSAQSLSSEESCQNKDRPGIFENKKSSVRLTDIGDVTRDKEIPEAIGAEIPEARYAEIPEAGDAEITEVRDAEIPETRDAEIPETRDAEIPEARDAEISETRNVEIPEIRDAEIPDPYDAETSETGYDVDLNLISTFQPEDSCKHLRTPRKMDNGKNSVIDGETINLFSAQSLSSEDSCQNKDRQGISENRPSSVSFKGGECSLLNKIMGHLSSYSGPLNLFNGQSLSSEESLQNKDRQRISESKQIFFGSTDIDAVTISPQDARKHKISGIEQSTAEAKDTGPLDLRILPSSPKEQSIQNVENFGTSNNEKHSSSLGDTDIKKTKTNCPFTLMKPLAKRPRLLQNERSSLSVAKERGNANLNQISSLQSEEQTLLNDMSKLKTSDNEQSTSVKMSSNKLHSDDDTSRSKAKNTTEENYPCSDGLNQNTEPPPKRNKKKKGKKKSKRPGLYTQDVEKHKTSGEELTSAKSDGTEKEDVTISSPYTDELSLQNIENSRVSEGSLPVSKKEALCALLYLVDKLNKTFKSVKYLLDEPISI